MSTDTKAGTDAGTGLSKVAALRTELVEEGGAALLLAGAAFIGALLTWYASNDTFGSMGGTDLSSGKWVLILGIVAAVIAAITLVQPISAKVALMLFADITILGVVCAVLSINKLLDANNVVWADPGVGVIVSSAASVGLVCAGLAGMYATRVFEDEWAEVFSE